MSNWDMTRLEDHIREQLRQMQRREKDKRRYVKITVVLMLDSGFSAEQIAVALGIDDSTVYRYIDSYASSEVLGDYMQDKYTRYDGKLTAAQLGELREHLRQRLYRRASDILSYITEQFSATYTATGLVPLLKRLGFVYKKTRPVSPKADTEAQQAFVEQFESLLSDCGPDDAAYFSDAVHPQHNTRAAYGWILSGEDVEIPTNTGRERININGALNASDVCDVIVREDDRINAQSTIRLYEQLQKHRPKGRIYVICDNARYYRSRVVKEWLADSRVVQVFLPSYSPNLNLIERLWKFLRKKVIDTEYYSTKEKFREAILNFFTTIAQHRSELQSLLTLNFHVA